MADDDAMDRVPAARPTPHPGLTFKVFVAVVAALMAVNALAVDSMLPALPDISTALHIEAENKRQWIVTAYLLGFGSAQILYGPLSDRFGRKPILLVGLSIYIVASVATTFAVTFDFMIAARVIQGIGAASTRVLAISIVRDCYSGRQMARVVSLAMIVFLTVPIIAPSIGQGVILFVSWRWIFGGLTLLALSLAVFITFRFPETLRPQDRRSLTPSSFFKGVRFIVTNRIAIGYILAMTLMMGAMFGFINSAQQVFSDVFHAFSLFPSIFACIAGSMAVASLVNARIVGRVGMKRMCHGAMLGFIVLAMLHWVVALADLETLWHFALLQCGIMFCFGLVIGNVGAITMEPLGHLAGIASSVQGFLTTAGGAVLGSIVGQHFDGTLVPMTAGFALYGVMAVICVLVAERGRLFRPTA